MTVAVVGAGIHGLCTAAALLTRGHHVAIFDRYPPGHVEGSSHGRSRIIRKAYPDPFYTAIMKEGYGLWDTLQARCRDQFVHHDGLLYFGERGSETMESVASSLLANGVELELVGPIQDKLPGLKLSDDEIGLFTAEAGWVHADLAIEELDQLCASLGATFEAKNIESVKELEADFDAVILAPGSNIQDFVSVDIQVRVQTVAYVEHVYEGAVWIEDGPDFMYGFPAVPGEKSIKIGVHSRGEIWDRQSPRPGPDETSLELIRDFAQRRFGIESPKIEEVVTCLYTMTPDEDFRWGKLSDKTTWVSACSGHGFKFGPWIGERLTDAVEGVFDLASISRFWHPQSNV